jgi:hypothetical protein
MCVFTEWLHRWQELVGAIIGATVIASTVWWTLSAERRRRNEETKALRIALGAEVRQYAAQALKGCQRIISQCKAAAVVHGSGGFTPFQMADISRFPEPVVYPNSASALGAIGEHAHFIVQFFNQISMIRDGAEIFLGMTIVSVPTRQALELARSLFNAADAAVQAQPAFVGTPQSEHDLRFSRVVASAGEDLEVEFARKKN